MQYNPKENNCFETQEKAADFKSWCGKLCTASDRNWIVVPWLGERLELHLSRVIFSNILTKAGVGAAGSF